MDQLRQIEQDRARLGVSPVRKAHVPKWFWLAVARAYPPGHPTRYLGFFNSFDSAWKTPDVITNAVGGREWLDHWGSSELPDGRVAFVSEPYRPPYNDEIGERLRAAAAEIGCEFWVDENSWHYPGSTVRLVFAPLTADPPRRDRAVPGVRERREMYANRTCIVCLQPVPEAGGCAWMGRDMLWHVDGCGDVMKDVMKDRSRSEYGRKRSTGEILRELAARRLS